MGADFWKANDEIHDTMRQLVAHNHPDLVLVVDEIAIVFKDKSGVSGGQVVLGNSKKVAPLANALGNTSYKFVLEIGSDTWENGLTSKQREALLDHLLCACRSEEDPKTGDLKCSVVKPDISAFRDNIERYGMWFPKEEDEEVSPVEKVFGKKTESDDE